MTEETLYDLNNLFNLVNEQERLLEDTKSILSTENKYQSIRIQNLEQKLQQIEQLYNQLQAGAGKYKKRVFANDFQKDPAANAQESAEIDTYHSLLTLPVTGKTQSKIYLYDEIAKEVVLPDSLIVALEPKENGINIFDNDIRYAFGTHDNIWARRFVFNADDTTSEVTTTITITLPDNIISSRDINTLTFHPFPLSTVDIDKIEYRMEGGWKLIPGFPQDSAGAPVTIQDATNLKFCFEAIPMAEVRITLTQRNFIIEDHQKVFYMGAEEIGIAYTDYQSSLGRFQVPVMLDGVSGTKLVTGVIPHFKNNSILSDISIEKRSVFNYAIYKMDEATGAIEYTRDILPIMVTGDVILIKANVNADPQTGTAPALESIEIQYEDLV